MTGNLIGELGHVSARPETGDAQIARYNKDKKEETMQQPTQMELAPPPKKDFRRVLFQGETIRQKFHNGEWFISIIDIVKALTNSSQPRKYWSDLKVKLINTEGLTQLSENIGQLKMTATDGRMRDTDVVNINTALRIAQSIPSPNAEPFKQWLSDVGEEAMAAISDPEIAVQRAIYNYKRLGRDDKWIQKRLQSVLNRRCLTSEWQKRGITEGKDYAKLTNTISKKAFGMDTSEYRKNKSLKRTDNLRDHMTPVELAINALGEAATLEFANTNDAYGFKENKQAAILGGEVAGDARASLEDKIGHTIISRQNYLESPEEERQSS